MDTHEIERLEQDLAAVERRLAAARTWDASAPRVRQALRRPTWSLVWTSFLIGASAVAGFIAPSSWLMAGGLALAVLPGRVRACRERRQALALAGPDDLFALYREELLRRMGKHLFTTFVNGVLIVLFLITAACVRDSRPGLLAAAAFAVWTAFDLLWVFPRTCRAIAALGKGLGEGADEA